MDEEELLNIYPDLLRVHLILYFDQQVLLFLIHFLKIFFYSPLCLRIPIQKLYHKKSSLQILEYGGGLEISIVPIECIFKYI